MGLPTGGQNASPLNDSDSEGLWRSARQPYFSEAPSYSDKAWVGFIALETHYDHGTQSRRLLVSEKKGLLTLRELLVSDL